MTFPAGASVVAQGASKLRYSKVEAALMEQLQARCGGELRKGALHAKHGTAEFQLSFLPKHQGFIVSVTCELVGRFRVTRKGTLDRWMEGFVPALKFRSHDFRFDRDFNVQTRDLRLSSDILRDQTNLAAVRQLFEQGVQAVHLDGERIKTTVPRKALGPEPVAEDILALVEKLAPIAAAVTAIAKSQGARASRKKDPAVVVAWTMLGVLGVLGFVMIVGGANEYTLVLPSRFLLPCALFGLPAAVLVVVGLTLAVQRRTSPYGLVRGLAGLSLVVVPLFVSGGMLVANGILDDSPAEEHIVSVVGKNVRKSKDDLEYSAGLASWWTDDDVRWVPISKATYDLLEPRVSRMQIRTHAGRLGYEWIETYTVVH
ncbi:MAG: hypothetical protein GY711_11990 [bacterium]|nr:hypothetical protein [bacterium]